MKKGAIISYAAVAFNALAGLLYTPWMISCIGSDDYALYTLSISVVNFFMLDFGLSTAVSRFLSAYYADGEEGKARRFLGIIYKLYLLISIVILIILFFIYLNMDTIYASLGPGQLETFKGLYLVVAGYSVVSFPCLVFNGVLTSKEEFVGLNLCNLLQKVLCVVMIVTCLLAGYGVFALVVCNAVTSVLFSSAKYLLIRLKTNARADITFWDVGILREVLGFSGWVVVSQVAGRLIFSIAPSLIAILSTSNDVTIFGLAASLEGYVYSVASALGGMFMPSVTKVIHEQGLGAPLQALMVRYGRMQLYIVGLVILGFFSLGSLFVKCWMGESYIEVYYCASMLILPSLVDLPQMAAGTALTAMGQVKAQALVYASTAIINMALTVPMTMHVGAMGASLAIMIAYLVRTAMFNRQYRLHLEVDPVEFYRETFSSWLLPATVPFLLGLLVSHLAMRGGWLALLALALLFSVVYGILMLRFSMNDDERAIASAMLRRLSRRN